MRFHLFYTIFEEILLILFMTTLMYLTKTKKIYYCSHLIN